MSDSTPLNQPQGWGDIDEVLNAPLKNVSPDASWISVIGMWLTLPLNIIQGLFGGLCAFYYRAYAFMDCCCTIYDSVMKGRPCYMAWTWWRYMPATLVALIRHKKSRFALFRWEWEACGRGEYFWQGEGIWATSHAKNSEIMRSQQERSESFACLRACVPDLFAEGLLIFLPTGGSGSEWAAVRAALHSMFLDQRLPNYGDRLRDLPKKIEEAWQSPTAADLADKAVLQRMVCRCVFFMMFGVWISEEDAQTLTGWRTAASFFVLPRLVQRFLFNIGIGKVKTLRRKTVQIIEKHKLQQLFVDMNEKLPAAYRREQVVKLCDQIMYVIGFAGIGGTSAAVESTCGFLQLKTGEVPEDAVDFSKYPSTPDMLAAYKRNPEKFIKEVCRLDPPVTSATSVLSQDLEAEMGETGKVLSMPKGSLRQYALSLANRDPKVFDQPSLFDPTRGDLSKSLTWNGEFDGGEDNFPRLCPGRYLSMQVARAIVDHASKALQAGAGP
uniref:Cytochrome P450 n=1 Tax=Alexandrium andersonii TaxID=327968 RepID=A0A7S2BFU4_9DINO|mmetsp:Transcript_25391/g.57694  ORF Transcript_25391/g.57694 Transcript_25391/m.57694 type:complete len:497 (+) Transcript_25391:77-1567(+)